MIRLVLLTDGTGQDGNADKTNVAQLCDYLENGENDQHCIYHVGVGTNLGEEVSGGTTGYLLEKVVAEQYSWLSRSAVSLGLTEKDAFEVELFGFSRGAFISRLLADLIDRCGIPKIPNDATMLVNLYEKKEWDKMVALTSARPNDFLKTRIGFLGCWDTVVTAAGYDGADYVNLPVNVVAAAHAVAINESRPKFNYTKMELRDGVVEEFFAGCHSDVGGGYGEKQVLSRVALAWMIERAEEAGVLFKSKPDPIAPDEYANAEPHSEHKSPSNLFGKLGFFAREIDQDRINQSVAMLGWDLFNDDGTPLDSEKMVAMVKGRGFDVGRPDGTMIA